jgi:hypothetical protein
MELFRAALRTQPFELHSLVSDYKTLMRAFRHWQRYIRHTTRPAAACAGKMWMALFRGAVMGRLEIPASILQKNLMH